MNIAPERFGRPLKTPGVTYAPTTESGVILLFGMLAKRLGFCIEMVRPQYTDCIAVRHGRRLRIEFEMWASSFEAHRHDITGVDMVVCWENDWEARGKRYRGIEVLSLKEHAGAEPRIYAIGCRECNFDQLQTSRIEWNVPKISQKGDLLLMYRSAPTSAICDIWRLEGGHQRFSADNPAGRWPGVQAKIRRLAVLQNPVTFASFSIHPSTRRLTIVQMRFRGKSDITMEWPAIYDRIVEANPSVRNALKDYDPN